MSDLSRCSWNAAKSTQRVGRQEADSACNKHLESVARGKAPDFTAEEMALMIANWRRDHRKKVIECLLHPAGILPESCKQRQLAWKRIYADGSRNTRYATCSGYPNGKPCPHWLSDEEYFALLKGGKPVQEPST